MDIPRPGVARNKKIRRIIILIAIVLLATAGTYGLSKTQAGGAVGRTRHAVAGQGQAWRDASRCPRHGHACP